MNSRSDMHKPGRPPLGKVEFVALAALLMAINALAIDIMLPALQDIGASLNVDDPNQRQFVVSAYVIGFGLAQLVFGPLSDRFGRRIPLLTGLVVYIVSAFSIGFAASFSSLLILRFIQGLGAAATRVITISVVRDIYGGRQMAEVMSLIMMVFMIIPVIAPGIGQIVLLVGEWHEIFFFMTAIATAITLWTYFRLPETIHREDIRPFTIRSISEAFRIVLTNRVAFFYTLANTFIFGALFGFINSAQQIYVGIYGLGVYFPFAFAAVALCMAVSSFLNSRLVGKFGIRRLSHIALLSFMIVNAVWLCIEILVSQPMPFPIFIGFFALAMFHFGWIGSNFNTLAMEPLGRVAGTAASILGFMTTVGGAIIGATIGQLFNGTALPLIAGFFTVSILGLICVLAGEKGKLFQNHQQPIA